MRHITKTNVIIFSRNWFRMNCNQHKILNFWELKSIEHFDHFINLYNFIFSGRLS